MHGLWIRSYDAGTAAPGLRSITISTDGTSWWPAHPVKTRASGPSERLCRYVARPALGVHRLHLLPDGNVRLDLKTPWADGTTALVLSTAELTERLAALVPPPKAHTVHYHGVLAPRAALRKRIVPTPPPPPPEASLRLTPRPAAVPAKWRSWAELLARVFLQAGWACPHCKQPMRFRAVVWPPAARVVLEGLARSARGPPQSAVAVP